MSARSRVAGVRPGSGLARGFSGEVSFLLIFSILPLQNAKGNVQATKIIDIGRHRQRVRYAYCTGIYYSNRIRCACLASKQTLTGTDCINPHKNHYYNVDDRKWSRGIIPHTYIQCLAIHKPTVLQYLFLVFKKTYRVHSKLRVINAIWKITSRNLFNNKRKFSVV